MTENSLPSRARLGRVKAPCSIFSAASTFLLRESICSTAPTWGTLDDDELAAFRSIHIGFIFQSYQLLPRLSAVDNVELPLIYQGVDPSERRAKALKALDEVGLAGRAGHRPTELSGGESQRVAIARALVGDPRLLLADEPTGNLDQATGTEIMDLIIDLNKNKKLTAIVVTHDPNVAALCNKQIKIRDGLVEQS